VLYQTQKDTIRVVTSSAATLDVNCIVEDANLGRRRYLTTITSATTTVISPLPTRSSELKTLIVFNSHASLSSDVTLQLYNGATAFTFYSGNLPPKHTLIFSDGEIKIYDNTVPNETALLRVHVGIAPPDFPVAGDLWVDTN
jgi:hypothetical protein